MKKKAILLLTLLCSFSKIYGQADPGSSGISFNQSNFSRNQLGTLTVNLGNYSGEQSYGADLGAYDAVFVITLPSTFAINGTITFETGDYFNLILTKQTKTIMGATEITLTSPSGIPKGRQGKVVIPITAMTTFASILYATVLTIPNQTSPPSGNLDPSNDFRYSPVFVSVPLPVNLTDFKAFGENTSVNLSWSTTEETNSERFDIERSSTGRQWEVIGSVAAQGESKAQNEYYFTDKNPLNGNNYYRLKMIDSDQTFSYSRINQLSIDNLKISVYPNPATDFILIETAELKSLRNIQLFDINGFIIYNSGEKITSSIDVRNIKAGTHIIKIHKTDGSAWTQRILVANGR
ncbi:T9SS type A sorting domain-containing protein [Dyadobacter psychrotolerans]|uniref:T9SS type A sorting domain-containing protein n=1 Tax=Dyadobacter psychrotolerans TaxID=2541721 RepID=A0A4R5DC43_9BACT|nr:T9SS type A sorting domain-containing protein [Dyadobacter psychrotolerans]TDE11286.1 T9SS type A sorting domain-containing protein [Dyadobacter psychrotolerans]